MRKNKDKEIIKVLREEYDSRLNYFLSEKITIKDKRDNNLVKYAKGLKVRDKAGFEYTFIGIVNKDGQEYIKLYLPEFGIEVDKQKSGATSRLFEIDGLNADDYDEQGFYSSKSGSGLDISMTNDGDGIGFSDKNNFRGDLAKDYEGEINYNIDDTKNYDEYNEDDYDINKNAETDKFVKVPKKEVIKYILVPLGEFEERFSV